MPRVVSARLLLAAIVGGSLMFKAAYIGKYFTPDNARMTADITKLATTKGYRTAVEMRGEMAPIVSARRGTCLVKFREVTFLGSGYLRNNAMLMAAAGPLHSAYKGQYLEGAGWVWADAEQYIARSRARLSGAMVTAPIIAVAANRKCLPPAGWFAGLQLWLRAAEHRNDAPNVGA